MAPSNPYDIDAWTNPYTPRPPFRYFPTPIAYLFGYRKPGSKPQQPHVLIIWAFAFIGAFLGVALLEGVYLNLPRLDGHVVPIIIASFGASSILEYNTIEAPLAQPRNLVFGHFLSALVGVIITKLFHLLPYADFDRLRWLAGALSVGTASVVMGMTKTIHPPAGATALLCATDVVITDLGWWYLALVLLGCMLMLTSALLINNLIRKFPVYWWTAADLAAIQTERREKSDVEHASQALKEDKTAIANGKDDAFRNPSEADSDATSSTRTDGVNDLQKSVSKQSQSPVLATTEQQIVIEPHRIVVPDWLEADEYELDLLRVLQQRLKDGSASKEANST